MSDHGIERYCDSIPRTAWEMREPHELRRIDTGALKTETRGFAS
jgi:hypothetical protein